MSQFLPRTKRLAFLALLVFLLTQILGTRSVCILTPRRLRELTLKHDLWIMREAIDNYTSDQQRPPESLMNLVNAGYLRELPTDPCSGKGEWLEEVDYVARSAQTTVRRVYDVHSTSNQSGLDGTPLRTW
jgi:general secretion pathway protein G